MRTLRTDGRRGDRRGGGEQALHAVPRTRSARAIVLGSEPRSLSLSFARGFFLYFYYVFVFFFFPPTRIVRQYDLTCWKAFTGRSERTWHRFRRIARAGRRKINNKQKKKKKKASATKSVNVRFVYVFRTFLYVRENRCHTVVMNAIQTFATRHTGAPFSYFQNS